MRRLIPERFHRQYDWLDRNAGVLAFLFVVVAGAYGTWTVHNNSATVDNLQKTNHKLFAVDSIACNFILADARTRDKQSHNTRQATVASDQNFLREADKVLFLIEKSKPTPGLIIFRDYIRAERNLVSTQRQGALANAILNDALADKARRLADQLHCQ
jgi:hypothetical protein